jgi:hypothetical protein
MTKEIDPVMFDCQVCGKRYQMGPHRYEGRPLSGYGVTVCLSCYEGNHDGWPPYREQGLRAVLEEQGIEEPPRLANGLLPREF